MPPAVPRIYKGEGRIAYLCRCHCPYWAEGLYSCSGAFAWPTSVRQVLRRHGALLTATEPTGPLRFGAHPSTLRGSSGPAGSLQARSLAQAAAGYVNSGPHARRGRGLLPASRLRWANAHSSNGWSSRIGQPVRGRGTEDPSSYGGGRHSLGLWVTG